MKVTKSSLDSQNSLSLLWVGVKSPIWYKLAERKVCESQTLG